jgi:hypothetical protein
MLRRTKRRALATMLVMMLVSGCGISVPAIQEIGDDHQGEILVQDIASSIRCEIRNALAQIYWDDIASLPGHNGKRVTDFLDNWGSQVQLTFTIKENTTVNPTASWMPNIIFSLPASVTGSTAATRIDKMTYFYKIAELRSREGCIPGHVPGEPVGSLLIQSDLKLHSALSGLILPIVTDDITAIQKQNAFTYEVSFEVVSTGTVSPTWKLSRVFSINQSGTLFSTSRDRTHDLLITLGPIDPNVTQTLAPTAQESFLASQITHGFNTSPLRVIAP